MPGVQRYTIDQLLAHAEKCVELGIPAIALFPGDRQEAEDRRRARGDQPAGPRPARGRGAEEALSRAGVITDVALDPYTTHGQDGVIDAQRLRPQRRDRRDPAEAGARRAPKPASTSSRRRT